MVSEPELMVCVNLRFGAAKPSCAARGSVAIADALEAALLERGIALKTTRSVCQNTCERGPSLRVVPGPKLFLGAKLDDVPGVVDAIAAHLAGLDGRENSGTP